MALRHCWGNKQPLLTILFTTELRKESLDWDLMLATLQDVIRVTRRFGISYLWTDSLYKVVRMDPCTFKSEARMDTSPDYIDRLREVAVFLTMGVSKIIFRQHGKYDRVLEEPEEDPLYRPRLTHRRTQVRAATI